MSQTLGKQVSQRKVPWTSGPAGQVKAAREATIDFYGTPVTFEAAIRQERLPGEGYQRKQTATFGPFQVYTYWSGGGQNNLRGQQSLDDNLRQDRDVTWGCSLRQADGEILWPTGQIDAMSQYEYVHPVYGRFRIDRVQQMNIQGTNVGWQCGCVRVS